MSALYTHNHRTSYTRRRCHGQLPACSNGRATFHSRSCPPGKNGTQPLRSFVAERGSELHCTPSLFKSHTSFELVSGAMDVVRLPHLDQGGTSTDVSARSARACRGSYFESVGEQE